MSEVETHDVRGITATISYDDCSFDPRKDHDNAGVMVCAHRRYDLGDERPKAELDDYPTMDTYMRRVYDAAVWLPLYLYDHSGLSISTGSFGDPWDSGCVGFIYMDCATLQHEFGTTANAERIENALALLRGEVDEYDNYLTGQVYRWETDGDGCGGYFGDDGLEYCRSEALDAAKHEADERDRSRLMRGLAQCGGGVALPAL